MTAIAVNAGTGRPWMRAAAWLALLGPFFFLSYGFANWMAARNDTVGSIVFAWERYIPLWPWTIVPYWSIDLLYAVSLFLCTSRRELDTHAKRLLAAQLISVACFLLFPLRFSFERPAIEGLFGTLFDILMAFDQPYNQAPSLHIALLVILWVRYAAHLGGLAGLLMHGWFALIGLSVLTTWQHHFIDLPTGFAVGALCLALFPDTDQRQRHAKRRTLAARYAAGALLVGTGAIWSGTMNPWLLWLWWPAASLALIALIYASGNAGAFGKLDGRLSWPLATLLAPYLLGAWLNSRLWTRSDPAPVEIADGVWLGRIPGDREWRARGFRSLVDCAAELPLNPRGAYYRAVPMLDLMVPETAQLEAAASAIETARKVRPTLVFCALGYSRSATAIAAWLLASGRAGNVEQATAMIRRGRPRIVLTPEHVVQLQAFLANRRGIPHGRSA